ncbi:MAG: putative signal transducing protein [Dysgonomonas sp.]
MEELVTIKEFDNMTRLGLVQAYLESEGIFCFVRDEYSRISTYNTEYIKLQVRESDVEKAIGLLIDGGFASPEDFDNSKSSLWFNRVLERFFRWLAGGK